MKEKRLLLVQVRTNPLIRDHDAELFRRVLGSYISHDVRNVTDADGSLDDAFEYDGVIVGGSHFMVYQDFPGKEGLYRLVCDAVKKEKPLLGVCFGFQVLTHVLGGEVVHDVAKKEFGSYDVVLTDTGARDPLFRALPGRFRVQQAHESYAREVPDCVELLAAGDFITHQAVRHKSAPAYGVQFHPEITRSGMHERMRLYNNAGGSFQFPQDVFDRIEETPESEQVLRNFLTIL